MGVGEQGTWGVLCRGEGASPDEDLQLAPARSCCCCFCCRYVVLNYVAVVKACKKRNRHLQVGGAGRGARGGRAGGGEHRRPASCSFQAREHCSSRAALLHAQSPPGAGLHVLTPAGG